MKNCFKDLSQSINQLVLFQAQILLSFSLKFLFKTVYRIGFVNELIRYAILQNRPEVEYACVLLASLDRNKFAIKINQGGSHDKTNTKQTRKAIIVILRDFRLPPIVEPLSNDVEFESCRLLRRLIVEVKLKGVKLEALLLLVPCGLIADLVTKDIGLEVCCGFSGNVV